MQAELSPGGRTRRMATALAVGAAACVLMVPGKPLPAGGTGQSASPDRAGEALRSMPLAFEPNAGRGAGGVGFIAHSISGGSLSLSAGEARLTIPDGRRARTVRFAFAGSNRGAEATPLERLPGTVSSFVGDDPSRWRSNLPTYGRIRYQGLYPGIDLDFYGNQRRLEYDLRLAPGADPSRIEVRLRGAESVRLAPSGDLVIEAGRRTLRQSAPVAYQRIGGARAAVDAAFELDRSTVRFRLGRYDRARPLVIDPLIYSTYLGAESNDAPFDVALDSGGNAYVTGQTSSLGTGGRFPSTPGSLDTSIGGAADAFVTKLNPAGSDVVYSTYLGGVTDDAATTCGGGSAADFGNGIVAADDGSVYVAGGTGATDFPTTLGNPQGDQGGCDAFLTKLGPGGDALAYSTYLGGSGEDRAMDVAVDALNRAHLAGSTSVGDFPTSAGAFDTGFNGGGSDGFLAIFSAAGSAREYSTFLGGDGDDTAYDLALGAGGVFLTGTTLSDQAGTAFPLDAMPFDGTFETQEGFFTQLNPAGSGAADLVRSSYVGGTGSDWGEGGVAVAPGGHAYLAGYTDSTDFTAVFGGSAFQNDHSGGVDGFLMALDPAQAGAAMVAYHTYFGGGGNDFVNGLAVDPGGNAYLAGQTLSSTSGPIPTTPGAHSATNAGGADAFLAKLLPVSSGAGSDDLLYATYLGGGGADGAAAVATSGNPGASSVGAATLAGGAGFGGPAFPTTPGAFDTAPLDPSGDGFVATLQTVLPGPAGPAPQPRHGASVLATPVSGTVLVKFPGSNTFIALLAPETIPLGSVIDTRSGRVRLVAATGPAGSETPDSPAEFYEGLFRISQSQAVNSYLEVKLVEPLSRSGRTASASKESGCRKKGESRSASIASAGPVARASARRRRVWGSGSGRYRTRGRGGTASVVGTTWLTQDTCSGTLFKVTEGKGVRVKDFGRKATKLLRPGMKYRTR